MPGIFDHFFAHSIAKRVNQQTEKLQHELTAAEEELKKNKELIATWNHDIGNPLNALKGVIALIPSVKESKDFPEITELLNTGCLLLEDIKANIDCFINGRNDTIFEKIELIKFLRSTVELYKPLANNKSITIELNISVDSPVIITSNKVKLSRVLSNLITNAIKFTSPGKSIIIRTSTKKIQLYIEIEDQGIGIPEDKLKDIFKPYVRLIRGKPGLGLGLAICDKFVNELDGSINVDSTLSVGTIFTIALPLFYEGLLLPPDPAPTEPLQTEPIR